MAEDRVCEGYKVIRSKRIRTVEIVLAYNPQEVQPYVTWKAYAHSQFRAFAYGNYFCDKRRAEADFKRRVAEVREDQGLPPQAEKPTLPKRGSPER